jgi:hypothetical protein
MSTLVRLLTLLTIAAAGFALPLNCAQDASAAAPVAIEIPALQQIEPGAETPTVLTGEHAARSIAQQLFDTIPFDCGDGPTSRASEHPAIFDTQPFVPGYLVSSIQLDEESADNYALPPVLIPIDSRAGPPDAPPPKFID